MKQAVFLIMLICLLFSCDDKTVEITGEMDTSLIACGISNPQKNLPWLAELIKKAEKDKTGNYIGSIWLMQFKGVDFFMVDMGLGSGGLAWHLFDCEGNQFVKDKNEADYEEFEQFCQNMQFDKLIYTNLKSISYK